MENSLYKPDDFSLYLHVVGGHSLFIVASQGHLLKSASENEIKFYSSMTSCASKFIPRFCGTIKKFSHQYNSIVIFIKHRVIFFKDFINEQQINGEDINVENDPLFNEVFNQFLSSKDNSAEMNNELENKLSLLKTELLSLPQAKLKWILFWFIKWKENFLNSDYIILEDLTHEMKNPAIIDIKIGSTPRKSKKSNTIKKLNETTNEIGCRIMGIQKSNMFIHRYVTRHFGMKEFVNKIIEFFSFSELIDETLLKNVINYIQGILNSIQEGIEYQMKFTSLLLVYDQENHSNIKINLIDFSYYEICDSFALEAQKDFLNSLNNFLQILINMKIGKLQHNTL